MKAGCLGLGNRLYWIEGKALTSKSDNFTVMACINQAGQKEVPDAGLPDWGPVTLGSYQMTTIAVHITWTNNKLADRLSRKRIRQSPWRLNPLVG